MGNVYQTICIFGGGIIIVQRRRWALDASAWANLRWRLAVDLGGIALLPRSYIPVYVHCSCRYIIPEELSFFFFLLFNISFYSIFEGQVYPRV